MELSTKRHIDDAAEKTRLEMENVRLAMELSTKRHIDDAGEKTRLQIENVRLAMELSIKRQIDDAFNGISAVIRGEAHNHIRIRDGEKEK
ncbi:hypothetical protein P167DRAFT_540844 [Morchella conica CCBAS932]|uniref:Uncharacterized protein n=1 Tax=Morchella conica CCBAS932 TaxID=1392247 RepID=A0A3N4KAE9_9PEZI|nr:hypothetical protein P167DRAFT_540844 [Morchella conica CCBAS932]